MMMRVIRTPLYGRFRAIDASLGNDLFGGITIVAEQNINISSINAGAVAIGGGSASSTGTIHIQVLTQQKIEEVRAELARLEAAVHTADLEPAEKERALTHIQEAKADPSRGKIDRVIELIGRLGQLAEAGRQLAPYALALGAVIGGG
jgi:hypothetical protein